MTDASASRAILHVDLRALVENYRALSRRVGEVAVGASVKANAYGLGVERVSRALHAAGCREFFVATVPEGIALRDGLGPEATIYVLNGPEDVAAMVARDLVPVLSSERMVEAWGGAGTCALMYDTGMNRLGLHADCVPDVRPALVMSHLACADAVGAAMNGEQLARARAVFSHWPGVRHSLANSGGIHLGADYHFDLVRPGIALYGGSATDRPNADETQPVVSLHAPILQVRNVAKGESVGYDATFVAERDMRVAVVGAGYADGLPVRLSSARNVAGYRGRDLDIVGRVSMDLTTVDVTGMGAVVGESVEFLGSRLEASARAAGTIAYELLTRVGSRPIRAYRD